MSQDSRKRFAEVYAVKLAEAIERNPDQYFYPVSDVPKVVAKMIPALANGSANFQGASKAAARALGIKLTIGAVKAYLTEGENDKKEVQGA